MNRCLLALAVVVAPLSLRQSLPAGEKGAPGTALPNFKPQEFETSLKVGYAVVTADVNGDGKQDLVVVDTIRVVWYENPTWKRHTLIEGQTKPDNVCIAAHDIDGDGKIDFALGAYWAPANTKTSGTLQWLKRGKSPSEKWAVHPIATEPTIHRIRFADIDGTGKPALISVPLHGRNSTAKGNWMDGSPLRVTAYRIPKNPVRDRWIPEVLDESLHVAHNFAPIPAASGKGADILVASYEGVSLLARGPMGKWSRRLIGTGNQETPKGKRGASEIKMGKLRSGRKVIATIEPWHGDQVVVYTEPKVKGKLWGRHVLDEKLRWGHAVAFADLDGDGGDELVIGVRDNRSQTPGERCGVRLYKALDERGTRWVRHILEDGGVAVEDLTVADLNGDGRTDIIAVGRATHNARIYWNLGLPK